MVSQHSSGFVTAGAGNCKCARLKDSGVQSRAGNKVLSRFDVFPLHSPPQRGSLVSSEERPPCLNCSTRGSQWPAQGSNNPPGLTKLLTVRLSSAGTPVYFADYERECGTRPWRKGGGKGQGTRPRRVKRFSVWSKTLWCKLVSFFKTPLSDRNIKPVQLIS